MSQLHFKHQIRRRGKFLIDRHKLEDVLRLLRISPALLWYVEYNLDFNLDKPVKLITLEELINLVSHFGMICRNYIIILKKMNEESKKNSPHFEAFYIESIRFNTLSAVKSFDKIEEELKKIKIDRTLILDNLQNIIIQAAGISKYFWPIRKQHYWRGERLRESFNMREDNPLKSRELRNAIEHFDERLDIYLENFISGIILPEYIGPYFENNGPTSHLFRAYFTDKNYFQLLGKSYKIQPIIMEVFKIHDLLIDMIENGSRLASNNEN